MQNFGELHSLLVEMNHCLKLWRSNEWVLEHFDEIYNKMSQEPAVLSIPFDWFSSFHFVSDPIHLEIWNPVWDQDTRMHCHCHFWAIKCDMSYLSTNRLAYEPVFLIAWKFKCLLVKVGIGEWGRRSKCRLSESKDLFFPSFSFFKQHIWKNVLWHLFFPEGL